MMMMKGAMLLFISLAIGYVLCVLAEKQKGTLKTAGYTLGIAIIVLSLLYGVADTFSMAGGGKFKSPCFGKSKCFGRPMMKACYK